MDEIVEIIAKKVSEHGGKAYFVGGYVRDSLLGKTSKDIDIEVHGISSETLLSILNEVGKPLSYGKSFGIYSLEGHNIDIALPRTEHKIGQGHKDFEVSIDPYIDLTKAIKRRDFTINAIYKDILSGNIVDPFNGVADLNEGIIRHIDAQSFVEDPLRVFRACQFSSRFNFKIASDTIELCKAIDTKTLSKQRVEEELKKALLQSKNPSLFFVNLKKMNQLDYWFNDININYIDNANNYIHNVENKYAYLLSCLTIDSSFDPTLITNEKSIIEYVSNMKEYINNKYNNEFEIYKIFDSLININDYLYLRLIIKNEDLFLAYEKYKQIISKPYVTGKDLINAGFETNEKFNVALSYANDLRLQGIEKDEALKMVIDYLKNI